MLEKLASDKYSSLLQKEVARYDNSSSFRLSDEKGEKSMMLLSTAEWDRPLSQPHHVHRVQPGRRLCRC
jgi:hypothetical protein